MDLSKYSFLEYLKHDATSFTWWQAIGLPLFIGVIFIITSVKAIKNETTSKKAIKILAITLAVSIIAIPFNVMAGILSTSIITMSLLSQIIYEKKHNKAIKTVR